MSLDASETTLSDKQRAELVNEVELLWQGFSAKGWNERVCNAMTLAAIQLMHIEAMMPPQLINPNPSEINVDLARGMTIRELP